MGINKIVLNTDQGEQVLIDVTEDTVTPETLFEGATAHDKAGDRISGTFTITPELEEQAALIRQIKTALQGKTVGSGREPVVQPLEVTQNGTYIAHDGVDGYSPVIVNVPTGGGGENLDKLIDGTITEVSSAVTRVNSYAFYYRTNLTSANFPNATSIGNYAFSDCSALASANFPNATSIGNRAFSGCRDFTTANFPAVTSIGSYAFNSCTGLTTTNFPVVTSIGTYGFTTCTGLTTANFPAVTSISNYGFIGCSNLTALILRNTTKAATLGGSSAFNQTPIVSGKGYIYVPAALVDTYKAATNWSKFASQFRAIEDYPEICG